MLLFDLVIADPRHRSPCHFKSSFSGSSLALILVIHALHLKDLRCKDIAPSSTDSQNRICTVRGASSQSMVQGKGSEHSECRVRGSGCAAANTTCHGHLCTEEPCGNHCWTLVLFQCLCTQASVSLSISLRAQRGPKSSSGCILEALSIQSSL